MVRKGSALKALGLKLLRQSRGLKRSISSASGRQARLEEFSETIDGLASSWHDADPGKYGLHWFWVRKYSLESDKCWGLPKVGDCEKFWVKDLLDKPAEARRGRPRHQYSQSGGRVKIPLGKLTEAARRPCPCCKKPMPVIGCYRQTEDSPEGDTWQLDLFVLCTACVKLANFARRCESDRFF